MTFLYNFCILLPHFRFSISRNCIRECLPVFHRRKLDLVDLRDESRLAPGMTLLSCMFFHRNLGEPGHKPSVFEKDFGGRVLLGLLYFLP